MLTTIAVVGKVFGSNIKAFKFQYSENIQIKWIFIPINEQKYQPYPRVYFLIVRATKVPYKEDEQYLHIVLWL